METTLRAVVESMEHAPACSFHSLQTHCIACRLTTLLDEAEKVDLVKKLRAKGHRLEELAKELGDIGIALESTNALRGRRVREIANRILSVSESTARENADELAQWLAVNLELIKAEHYAAGFDAGMEAQARTEER